MDKEELYRAAKELPSDSLWWLIISIYEKLPEDFLRDYANKFDWPSILHYQSHISDEFLSELQLKGYL